MRPSFVLTDREKLRWNTEVIIHMHYSPVHIPKDSTEPGVLFFKQN